MSGMPFRLVRVYQAESLAHIERICFLRRRRVPMPPCPCDSAVGRDLEWLSEFHRQSQNGRDVSPRRRNPDELRKLAQRVIRPLVEAIRIDWYGWHGFRRGIAANLYELSADDTEARTIGAKSPSQQPKVCGRIVGNSDTEAPAQSGEFQFCRSQHHQSAACSRVILRLSIWRRAQPGTDKTR